MNDLLKNKWVLAMIMVVIIALTVLTFVLNLSDNNDNEVQVDQQTTRVEETADMTDKETKDDSAILPDGYYFVAEEDGEVNVYRYLNGQKEFYQQTSIAFSLLSSEDQQLLKTGIQLKNEQELANFLENFDS